MGHVAYKRASFVSSPQSARRVMPLSMPGSARNAPGDDMGESNRVLVSEFSVWIGALDPLSRQDRQAVTKFPGQLHLDHLVPPTPPSAVFSLSVCLDSAGVCVGGTSMRWICSCREFVKQSFCVGYGGRI